MRFLMIGLAMVCGVTASARADWENTKWGMTRAEVEAIRHQPLAASSKTRLQGAAFAGGEYVAGNFRFNVDYQFAAGDRLAMIGLTLKDPSGCADLHSTLTAKYGGGDPATRDRFAEKYIWTDQAKSNVVEFVNGLAVPFCDVTYRKLDAAAVKGL